MEFKLEGKGYKAAFEYGDLHVSGDEQYGIRPFQLLISSVAGCSGTTLKKILDKKRIAFDDIRINAEVKRNPDEADRVEKIHLHFTIKGKDLEETKVEKSLDIAKKNCSMVQSVIGSIEVTETFELVQS